MNQHTQDWFVKWRAKYMTQNNCTGAEWRVQRTETGNSIHKGCSENDTVSEGIGYGMVVLVYMENTTNNTKAQFDGLYTYYKNHLDGAGLMNWQIPYCDSGGSATDADEDVAMALLAAEWQWGNATGTFNYGAEASTIIGRILASEITAANDIRPGDGWDGGNISYFAPYQYRMFATKTGVTRWNLVAQRTYQTIVNYYYNSPLTTNAALGIKTGLQPNWCNYDGTPWSPGAWAMRADTWWWDAIRHAWRQGYDYVLYGTSNNQLAYNNSARLSYFFKTKYGGDASLIKSHYTLDGTETTYCRGDRTPDLCTEDVKNLPGPEGAVAIAAMAEGDQDWLNECYYTLVTMNAGTGSGGLTETGVMWGTDYFNDILKMQYLLILTGNMPNPMGNPPTPTPTWTITIGPSPTDTPVPPPGMFDDFETGALKNPDTSESNGAVLTISNTNERANGGTQSLKGVTTGGAWAIFSIDSPYDGGLGYRNYTGATAIEFDIYSPAGAVFFVEIEEGLANGADGERFSNRGNPTTKVGNNTWQHVTLTIASLTRDTYSPVMGNNAFNLGAIQSFLLQLENPGNMTFYVDNVQFTGTFPTITPTRTATRTRTPAGTLTITPTRTVSATNTPYYSPTTTRTSTVTPTETLFISSTVTRTGTITPTWTASPYIPADVFDDFETAVLKNPSTSDTGGGSTLVIANSGATVHAGTRSMSAVTTGGGWAVGSIDSPYDGGLGYRNFTGATGVSFWIYTTSVTGVFIKIVESNGQQWSNRGAGTNTTGTGWQQVTLALSIFTVDDYSPAGDGNTTLNLNIIKSVQFQWDNPGAKTIYLDDIRFTGIPTPTFTRTSTRTPTFTRTGTYTVTPNATFTSSASATASPSATQTRTVTASPTASFTATCMCTATATVTGTGTITPTVPNPTGTFTATNTSTPTYTGTGTGTYTSTATVTGTITPTVTMTNSPTFTMTFTSTYSRTVTWSSTPTFTVTATATFTITRTHTVTPTISPSWTGTPPTSTVTPTVSETWTNSPTNTVTVTNTYTPTITLTYTTTVTRTRTATATFSASVTDTFTRTPTEQDSATYTRTATMTGTATFTATGTPTYSVTVTATPSISPTHSVSPSITQTVTGTPPTATVTPTITRTWTNSVTATPSFTMTASRTQTPSVTLTNTLLPTAVNTFTQTQIPVFSPTVTATWYVPPSATSTAVISPTHTATTIVSDKLEIKDPLAGPNPYPGTGSLMVRFTATRPCSKTTFKVFTNAFRLIKKIDLGSCGAGVITRSVSAASLRNLSNGSYFYVIEGESDKGRAQSTIEKILIIK